MVGKVNMDRNGSPQLQEESAQASADATVQWIKDTLDKFEKCKADPYSEIYSVLF